MIPVPVWMFNHSSAFRNDTDSQVSRGSGVRDPCWDEHTIGTVGLIDERETDDTGDDDTVISLAGSIQGGAETGSRGAYNPPRRKMAESTILSRRGKRRVEMIRMGRRRMAVSMIVSVIPMARKKALKSRQRPGKSGVQNRSTGQQMKMSTSSTTRYQLTATTPTIKDMRRKDGVEKMRR